MNGTSEELDHFEKLGQNRSLETLEGIDFASNDYLGYSGNSSIRSGLIRFLELNPLIGATGSRLISGNSPHIERTEEFLAFVFGSETSLIFGSGYLANMGVLSALGSEKTAFFSDELNHASIVDGIRISRSQFQIFRHNDIEHLENLLSSNKSERKIIVTESIFSMDGDQAPLNQLVDLANKFGAGLVIDEAHATGTSGRQGLGLSAQLEIDPERIVVIHTCGKALGGYGAFVCCTHRIKRLLLNKARSQIFTTALPPMIVEHIRLSVSHLLEDKHSVKNLAENISVTKRLFYRHGFRHSGSHVIPFIIGSNSLVQTASNQLRKKGLSVKAIRSPSVKAGSERLRLTVKATHTLSDLEKLCDGLKEIFDESICHRN